jgi:hypothetical protein
MQVSIRVVTLAQKEALVAFVALADAMIETAEAVVAHTVRSASGKDQRHLDASLTFLHKEGANFRLQLKSNYQTLLERAMRTMHTDLRTALGDFRADSLSLIEDDVVTRAIEVDRLVKRLRDADEISLGHLNLIIAQLHGVSDVSERENPFRPYLLARALHDTVRDMLDQATAAVLFQHLASAMAMQLGKFYRRIRDVFESQGVRSRLLARPTALSRYERDRLALKRAADMLLGKTDTGLDDPSSELRARMIPRMQRMLELVDYKDVMATEAKPAGGNGAKPMSPNLQELVWDVFHQPRAGRFPRKVPDAQTGRSRLEHSLSELQRNAITAVNPEAPLAMRDRVAELATKEERLSLDLMGLLFDFVLHDEQLHAAMRQQLVRLHLPVLRAALLQPTLLHDASHPARRLLNRCGSLAVIVGSAAPDAALLRELARLVRDVLTRFETDPVVFVEAESALENFLAGQFAQHDPVAARARAAFDRAEVAGAVLESMRGTLRDLLEPITADRRMIDFIVETWSQVMVHCHDFHPAYSAMLPELLWSAQERPGPEERTVLLRLLPDLSKRLRAGLAQIGMSEAQAKEALDKLMVLHMDVLANKRLRSNAVRLTQAALQEELAAFRPELLFALARDNGKSDTSPAEIAASLVVQRIDAVMAEEPVRFLEQSEDADCLQWARSGTAFEQLVENEYRPLMLEVASGAGHAFLFRHQSEHLVYSRRAFLAAMRSGSLRSVEHAPLFERAVESVMSGAESLAA